MTFMVKHEQKAFIPCPEGLHPAVCVDLVDLGMVDSQFGTKPKLRLYWQVSEDATGLNPETKKRFTVQAQYTVSLHEKATLRKNLETWRGRKFTKEELSGFDLDKLVGANCQLQIQHSVSDDGRVFANVQAIVPPHKGDPVLRPLDYVRVKDRPENAKPDPITTGGATSDTGSKYDDDVPF